MNTWLAKVTLALSLVTQSATAVARDYGPRFVERELPEFYRVVLTTLAHERTQLFFKEWTSTEVGEFRTLQKQFVDKLIPARGSVPAPIDLYEIAGEKIFSSLGEIYGASYLRARARHQRGLVFMSERTYKDLNWDSYRNPDGLLYRVDGSNLFIVSILESKLGPTVRLSERQVEGLADQWAQRGIRVIDTSGVERFFSKFNVYIGESDSATGVSYAEVSTLKRIMTLVSHRRRVDFPGYLLAPPFSPIDGRNIVFKYFERLVADRRWDGLHSDPEISAEELLPVVKDWIMDRRSWPKESGKRVEKVLARNIRLFGGQSAVFLELDAEHQEILSQSGMVPALGSLHNTFVRLRKKTSGALRAFRYYASAYYPSVPIASLLQDYARANRLFNFIHTWEIPSTCQLKLFAKDSSEE